MELPEGVTRYCLQNFAGKNQDIVRERSVERIRQICQIVREEKIDLFISHQWLNNFLIWDLLAVKISGALFCIHCHSVFSVPLIDRNMLHCYKTMPEVYSLADGVFALSDADQYYWGQYNPFSFKVINPLPFENMRSERRKLENHAILWVGRISREKRPFDLPEIMQRVVSVISDAKLIVVGGGNAELEEDLRSSIAAKGLENNIILTGFQKDVTAYYKDASIYLSTSEYEGFPVAIGEAQIYGLPVVGYDLFYLSILRSGKGCHLASIGRTGKLAEMLIKLLSSPEEYEQSSEDALNNIKRFNIDLAAQWQEIFTQIMNRDPGFIQDPRGTLSLNTIRQQVTLRGDWETLSGKEKSAKALDVAFPLPESGPLKSLRRKTALMLRVLLIDGVQGVAQRLRTKKSQTTGAE